MSESGGTGRVAAAADSVGLLGLIDARGMAEVPLPELRDTTPPGVTETVRQIINREDVD